MDRRLVYIGAIPQDLDALTPQRNAMSALGYLAQGVLGTTTLVDGLACSPTSPASLVVNIGAGSIYALNSLDATAFGSLGADTTHQIVKQGVLWDAVALTLTPPSTPGQAINFLVQAQLLEQDITPTVLPYFNPASLTNPNAVPYSGPNNSGVSQPVTRQSTITVTLKTGVAATAGSQVTPTPDPGYVGLYAITVAQGQTQVTSANIAVVDNAPFISPKLPAVPGWVQSGSYCYAEDTSAVANAITVTLNPLPASIGKGFAIRAKVANANTGATTLTILRNTLSSLGPYAVVRATGTTLVSGDIAAGQVVDLVFDGTSFRDITGTTTNTAVGSLTAQSGEGINVDGTAHVNLNYPGLSSQTPQGPDLFSFYSQGDTHHRVLTFAQLLASFQQNASALLNIQVITASGSYTKTTGARKAVVFATGGGGAGSVIYSCGAGGGAGATAISLVDVSALSTVPCTIGAGGVGTTPAKFSTGIGGDGGATSFGSYVIAGGGQGGPGTFRGGFGGTASAGLALIPGGDGEPSLNSNSGNGGASFWGGGGGGADTQTGTGNGWPGRAYGAGGGGGDSGYTGRTGGNGAPGVIFILEF